MSFSRRLKGSFGIDLLMGLVCAIRTKSCIAPQRHLVEAWWAPGTSLRSFRSSVLDCWNFLFLVRRAYDICRLLDLLIW